MSFAKIFKYCFLICLIAISCVKIEPKNVVPIEFKEGQKQFHRVCAVCHGADVSGGSKAPNLVQEKYFQVSYPNRKIKKTILNGSTSGSMPSQKNKLTDEEIKEIIKYIRYVQKQTKS